MTKEKTETKRKKERKGSRKAKTKERKKGKKKTGRRKQIKKPSNYRFMHLLLIFCFPVNQKKLFVTRGF